MTYRAPSQMHFDVLSEVARCHDVGVAQVDDCAFARNKQVNIQLPCEVEVLEFTFLECLTSCMLKMPACHSSKAFAGHRCWFLIGCFALGRGAPGMIL